MNLQLSLKKKWFDMTKAGVKTEDYREINDYWVRRLINGLLDDEIESFIIDITKVKLSFEHMRQEYLCSLKEFTQNTMTLGYPKSGDKERILKLEHKGIEIRTGNPAWGAEPDKLYFVILHGCSVE